MIAMISQGEEIEGKKAIPALVDHFFHQWLSQLYDLSLFHCHQRLSLPFPIKLKDPINVNGLY